MAFERVEHWEFQLSNCLDLARCESFKWGQRDCATFANSAVLAVTGQDVLADIAPVYDSWRTAAKWLIDNGYRSFHEAICDRLGQSEHPAMARRGDIVMRRQGNTHILGVCVGQYAWFLGDEIIGFVEGKPVTQPSLVHWPTLDCFCCWRLG